ncbi:MAG: HAD-IA family hydrolase [Fimbriimonadaceae bacterium]|nr:HAD-IA family hydrolase [Fimbriimonadaceae bacterium]
MMRRTVVSLDCAQTLLEVTWDPVRFVMDRTRELGLNLPSGAGADLGRRLLAGAIAAERASFEGGEAGMDAWWRNLAEGWLAAYGLGGETDALIRRSQEALYGPDSPVYRLPADTLPALDRLQAAGMRLVVVSNWDASLRRTLTAFGLDTRFQAILASMVVGSAKPDLDIFRRAEAEMGAGPEEFVHVGDHLEEDGGAASAAGWGFVHIDRSEGPIRTLLQAADLILEGRA